MACPRGNICELCCEPAEVEVHWPSWAGKYCSDHAFTAISMAESSPVVVFNLSEDGVIGRIVDCILDHMESPFSEEN